MSLLDEPTNSFDAALQELGFRSSQLDLSLSAGQIVSLRRFLQDLSRYNEHTNLVARSDFLTLVKDHVTDSLSVASVITSTGLARQQNLKVMDIGAGAGFPGIVLAVVLEDLLLDLVDSVGKKTCFLNQVVQSLELSHRVSVHNARAEVLARQSHFRAKFDLSTARAVGSLDLISELAVPFLRVGGKLIAQKSTKQYAQEIEDSQYALSLLGAQVSGVYPLDRTILGKERVIVMIEKIKETPEQFPRSTAQIARGSLSKRKV